MGITFVKCKTCLLIFNSGLDSEKIVRDTSSQERSTISCPLGHSHDYDSSEFIEESVFDTRGHRIAGRPVSS